MLRLVHYKQRFSPQLECHLPGYVQHNQLQRSIVSRNRITLSPVEQMLQQVQLEVGSVILTQA